MAETALETAQQHEIQFLRERVRQLEDALAPQAIAVPVEWQLTASEARLYAHIASRAIATRETVMLALYSDRAGEAPDFKIVDVFVCKLRKKLAPFGVVIRTHWGQGYSLGPAGELHQHEETAA